MSSPSLGEDDLHEYQEEAVSWLWDRPFSALFIDTGLGKTVIMLTLIVRLLMHGFLFKKVLIIAPIRVAAQTWPNEIVSWAHTTFLKDFVSLIRAEDDDDIVVAAGKEYLQKARESEKAAKLYDEFFWGLLELGDTVEGAHKSAKRHVDKWCARVAGKARTHAKEQIRRSAVRSNAPIHIINKEQVAWLVQRLGKKWFYDCVIIDESSCLRDYQSEIFRHLKMVRPFIKRMHQLTATPAAETYLHLFPQIFLLDEGKRFTRFITHFRNNFFRQNAYTKKWTLLPGAEAQISELISDIALVMKSRDYLDEQEPLFLPRRLHMQESEAEAYKRFEQESVLEIQIDEDETEIIEAETAGDLSSKLCQLASGAVYNANGKYRVFHDHKIEDLRQLRDELEGEPLMVAYWYQSSLDRLKKAFPDAVVMDKTGKAVEPWNKGKIKMLLVHPASVGHGLNMQKGPGHDIYFFDACWSYELYYQLYRRLHRQGQKKQVRVHLPQVVGTVDETVFDRLLQKEDAQEALFRRIKALYLAAKDARNADERRSGVGRRAGERRDARTSPSAQGARRQGREEGSRRAAAA